MYQGAAPYYDILYRFKDYAQEVSRILTLLGEPQVTAGKQDARPTLLDVACGTGVHLAHFAEHFTVEGLDLSEDLLLLARERLPEVPLHCADMRTFQLDRTFDVVTCLFSAIGYVHSVSELDQTIARMAEHVAPGGSLVVEPWFTPEVYRANTTHLLTIDEPELKIARVNTSTREGNLSIMELHHLIGTPEETKHVVERHELYLFTPEEMVGAFEKCGLEVEIDEEGLIGRGLYLGRKEGSR